MCQNLVEWEWVQNMAGRLEGKVAFITGAARGQGRSHAIKFAEEGADIIAVDLLEQIPGVPYALATPEDRDETVRAVEALGRRIVFHKADVRDIDRLSAAVAEGVSAFGRLDIVVANAGISGPYTQAETPAERVKDFQLVIDVNLTGVANTVEAARESLLATPGGSIVITSSLAGLKSLGAGGGYTESKHGLVGMMRSYAHEFAPHMVRVNSVHPTNVRTPMIMNDTTARAFRPDLEDPSEEDVATALSFLNLMPIPYVDPIDITNAVLFLVTDDSRYVTGVALPVDAGAAIK